MAARSLFTGGAADPRAVLVLGWLSRQRRAGSAGEAEPEMQRRRVVSPSVPSIEQDLVRPTESMWSLVHERQRRTLNLFFHPRPEVNRLPRWRWIQSRNSF